MVMRSSTALLFGCSQLPIDSPIQENTPGSSCHELYLENSKKVKNKERVASECLLEK